MQTVDASSGLGPGANDTMVAISTTTMTMELERRPLWKTRMIPRS